MEHSVKLSKLPDGLTFPDRLQGRIRFDAGQGRLVYQGFMTKCTYDELSAISNDPDYHRALEQLFVSTSEEVGSAPARRGIPAAIVLATIGTLVLALVVFWSVARHASAQKRNSASPQNPVSAVSR